MKVKRQKIVQNSKELIKDFKFKKIFKRRGKNKSKLKNCCNFG